MKKLAIIILSFCTFSMAKSQSPSPSMEKENAMESTRETGTSAGFSRTEEYNASPISRINFEKDFPNAQDVTWKGIDAFDQATFTATDGSKTESFYDFQGSFIGTSTDKKLADLPEKAQRTLTDKYSDYVIGPIIYYHDNDRNDENMVKWATIFESEDQYFAELNNNSGSIVVRITPSGYVTLFKKLN